MYTQLLISFLTYESKHFVYMQGWTVLLLRTCPSTDPAASAESSP